MKRRNSIEQTGRKVARTEALATPQHTVYVRNLQDKLKKRELIHQLYLVFSTYGHILDIVALKTARMRGQAHVTFADVSGAVQAVRALQQFDFFGKPMVLDFARTKSHALAKLDGTYKMSAPRGAGSAD